MAADAFFGEGLRSPDVIDAEAVVFLECAHPVIPPGEFSEVAVQFAEDIDEAPLFDVMDGGAFGFREMEFAFPGLDVPDIGFFGRDIEIAA